MASSSKNISMPLVFAISVGSVFAMVASTLFAMAWYAYESKKVVNANIAATPMHSADYEAAYGDHEYSAQVKNLNRMGQETFQAEGGMPETHRYMPIGQAMDQVVAENVTEVGHDHTHEDGDDHDHDDHEGHEH